MKMNAMTQTVANNRNGGSSMATSTLPPLLCGSVEVDGSDIIISTFGYHTRITPSNYKVFRYYRWWTVLNYRVIVEVDGGYRAVDFRGRKLLRDPRFFEDLGYSVTYVDRFWRRSLDSQDEADYGLDFSPS